MFEVEAVVETSGLVDMAFLDEGGEEGLAAEEGYGLFFGGEVVAIYAEEFEGGWAGIIGLGCLRVDIVGRAHYGDWRWRDMRGGNNCCLGCGNKEHCEHSCGP